MAKTRNWNQTGGAAGLWKGPGMNATGNGAGRWKTPGKVYVMKWRRTSNSTTNYFKIGCSKDPKKRRKQVNRAERKRGHKVALIGSVRAHQMNGAESAAQRALKKVGLVKDTRRGTATDWFKGPLNTATVMKVMKQAVYSHNTKHRR